MSVVTVLLGQCGNQIGHQLYSTLYEDTAPCVKAKARNQTSYTESSLERFFDCRDGGRVSPRAVLVDMESKVVQRTVSLAKRSKLWEYDERCVYTQQTGSGNNWANGYSNHAPSACDNILDKVQMQVERCDTLDGFLVVMSVAGGTGSGVGARVTECLRERYPHSTLVNQVVWPYASGEVIVQDYNTLLTTSHLQRASDALLLLQNDQLHSVCAKLLRLKEVTLNDINSVVCHSLASVLQPAVQFEHLSKSSAPENTFMYNMCPLGEMCAALCPDSAHKILSLKSIPQMPEQLHAYTRYLWAGLIKHLRQMLITDSQVEEGMDWTIDLGVQRSCLSFAPSKQDQSSAAYSRDNGNKSLANLLVLRGNELETVDVAPFKDPRLYSSRVPMSCTCSVWCCKHTFNKYDKSCTLVSNGQGCIQPLDSVCQKAWNMYTAGAYVHQYERFGLEADDFVESFITVEQIIKNYSTI